MSSLFKKAGFGSASGHHMRLSKRFPLVEGIHVAKSSGNFVVRLFVAYPGVTTGFQISPVETSFLSREGLMRGSPDRNSLEMFWGDRLSADSTKSIIQFSEQYLPRLADATSMEIVMRHLLGFEDMELPEWAELILDPMVQRRESPQRITSLAGYLIAQGKFDDAKALLSRLPNSLRSYPANAQIISDAATGRISKLAEEIQYLKEIGAVSNSNLGS